MQSDPALPAPLRSLKFAILAGLTSSYSCEDGRAQATRIFSIQWLTTGLVPAVVFGKTTPNLPDTV
jgi:hypothetical protein